MYNIAILLFIIIIHTKSGLRIFLYQYCARLRINYRKSKFNNWQSDRRTYKEERKRSRNYEHAQVLTLRAVKGYWQTMRFLPKCSEENIVQRLQLGYQMNYCCKQFLIGNKTDECPGSVIAVLYRNSSGHWYIYNARVARLIINKRTNVTRARIIQ